MFTGASVSSWRRETVVLSAIVILGVFAAALFAIDGYVWYISYHLDPAPVSPARSSPLLTAQDIDEALMLLDAREKKMNAIFDGE